MNQNLDDYYYSQSDNEKRRFNIKSPTPRTLSILDGKPQFNEGNIDGNSQYETDQYVDDMKKGTSNILVAVRLRPLWYKEIEQDQFEIVRILDSKVVILMDPANILNEQQVLGKNRSKEKQYAFDFAFDKEASQIEVFTKTTKFLCDGILNGYNATVFAYGATGAGKTYTMLGTEENPGIMFLTLKGLFNRMQEFKQDRKYTIRVSFLEIYNEQIKDLIMVSQEFLDLREDPLKGVQIAGLSEIEVDTPEEILDLLIYGNRNRTQESTGANETSSRSHAVLQIVCEHQDRDAGIEAEIRIGKLSLIDLAGSERAAKTNNRGIRMIEGANINRSLLALGNCINMLHENNQKGQSNYIPFRDSKLTRLLKDSLGGNCRTVMIANIAPSNHNYDDTQNTLKYANRAKNIKTNLQRNVVNVEYHFSKYTNIISQLKGEISDLKQQLQQQKNNKQVDSNNNTSNFIIQQPQMMGNQEFDKVKEDLNSHFGEELKTKQKLNEFDQKLETLAIQIINKKSELAQLVREKGRDNIQYKIINEEIDECNQQLSEFKQKFEQVNSKMKSLLKKRENLQQEWKMLGIKDLQFDMLNHIQRENTILLDNMEFKRKEKKSEAQSKLKEIQVSKLYEQIKYRDEVIFVTRKILDQDNIDNDYLDDPRIIQLEEIINHQNQLFPPIPQTQFGKATNTLVKNLINSSNKPQSDLKKNKSNYHSLPPINVNNKQESEKQYIKSKFYNEQSEHKRYQMLNKDISMQRIGQFSKLNNYGIQSKGQISSTNIHQPLSIQQSLNQYNQGHFTNNNSKSNLLQGKQINFASNFAKNLQIKKNQINQNIAKKNLLQPSPNNQRLNNQLEERKRSSSVISNGSFISTASSNSPKFKNSKRQKLMQQQSLQVAGVQLGSNRKFNYGQKFNQRNVTLSIAGRKKENKMQYQQNQFAIEQSKKKALDQLNKNYRKKY